MFYTFRKCVLGSLFFLLLFMIMGCGPQVERSPEAKVEMQSADGVIEYVPPRPKRILSLSSAYDTILLGIVDTSRFAAVSSLVTYEGYSLEAARASKVKTKLHAYSLEKIISLHPDVVLAPDYTSKDTIEGLRAVGIPTVVVASATTVEGVIKTVKDIAHIVGEDAVGQAHEEHIRKDIEWLRRKGELIPLEKRKSILFVSSMDGYTGTKSIFDDMCQYMSIYNGPSLAKYPPRTSFTDERIMVMNPDFIFIPSYKGMDKSLSDRFFETPAFNSLKAMQLGQVRPLKAAYLYTSNHHIGEAMVAIMKEVYPEYTKDDGGKL